MDKVVLLLALLFSQLTVRGDQRLTACGCVALPENMPYKQGLCVNGGGNGRTASPADSSWVVSMRNDTVIFERVKERGDSVRVARGRRMRNGMRRTTRPAHEGFKWGRVSGAGISLMAQRSGKIRLMADQQLPGIVMVRDGDARPRRLIQLFDIGTKGAAGIVEAIKSAGAWDDSQPGVLRPAHSGRADVRRYVMVPYGNYAVETDELMKKGPVPSTCNGWGVGNSGYRYFEIHDAHPDKAVFVEIGQDAPLFDENSIMLNDGQEDSLSADVLYRMRGVLTIAHEVRSFRPEGSDKDYWIVDKTGELEGMYDSVTGGEKNGKPVNAVLKLEYNGKWDTGFAEGYDAVFFVREIVDLGS